MEQPCAEIVHVGRDGGFDVLGATLCGDRAFRTRERLAKC